MIIEGNYPEPTPKRGPKLIYKVTDNKCFTPPIYIISLTGYVLRDWYIVSPHNLHTDSIIKQFDHGKEKEALRRFEEFTSHVIETK